ncbi:hypothetical protein AQUCO_02800031v1, partial [Aquilegia coerulea]
AGIALGPTLLGHISHFPSIFPPRSYAPLHIYGNIGTIMQLFLTAVQLDPKTFIKPGKKGVIIGISVVLVPLAFTSTCGNMIKKYIGDETGRLSSYLDVIRKVESINSFPVIASYLIELNILNTEVSNIAFCASMISGFLGSIIVGDMMVDEQKANYKSGGAVFAMHVSYAMTAGIMVAILRPTVRWIIKKTPKGQMIKQEFLNLVIALVLLAVTISSIGSIHAFFAPVIAGLIIPSGLPLGSVLVQQLNFFNKWIVMPTFYTIHGVTTANLFAVPSTTVFLVVMVILVSFVGKFVGAFLPAIIFNMSYKDATLLGLAVNAQGFLEIVVFSYLKDHDKIDEDCFTVMCVSMIILTGASAPLMRYLYKNSMTYSPRNQRTIQHTVPNSELRVLGCMYDEENVPSMIHVLRATNPTKENPIHLSIIHFVELVNSMTPLIISHKVHTDLPPVAAVSQHIVNVFKYYEESNKGIISVNPYTVVSNYPSMYNNVCSLAFNKRTSLILLPYHKNLSTGSNNFNIRTVNCDVLKNSPCSVGILIDRGLQNGASFLFENWVYYRVAVVFFGGADDREALAHAKRMSEHPAIELTVFRFLHSKGKGSDSTERSLDDAMVKEFKLETTCNNRVRYIEEEVENGVGVIKVITSMENDYELIILGRRHDENLQLIIDLTDWNKCSELGTIGDIFITSGYGEKATLLVIQQQTKVGVRSESHQGAELIKIRYDVDLQASSFRMEK